VGALQPETLADRRAESDHTAARPGRLARRRRGRAARHDPGDRALLPGSVRPPDPDQRPRGQLPRSVDRLGGRLLVKKVEPAQRDHEATHPHRHDLPAAVLPHRLLRAELRLDDPAHRQPGRVPGGWAGNRTRHRGRHAGRLPPPRLAVGHAAGTGPAMKGPAMKRSRRGSARDGLLVLLTLTTGAVDASSFLHLGNVFSSVITGNLILLGVAAATRSSSLAIHSGTALAGYSVGVLIAAPIATRRTKSGETWPLSVTVTLAVEFCVLAGFSVGWELTGGSPGSTAELLLIAALSVAMGIQSAAVRELGGMSTTYLTGTLTAVISELATRDRKPGLARSVGVIAAIVSGAVGGGLVAEHAPAWLPAVVLTPLAVVVIAS